MKLASTRATILCNNMESRHPWRTNIRIKGSDRRPFILILDSILLCATLIMCMNLSPYPNLRKAEKINSTLKDITGRLLFSLFDSSVLLQITERVCTLRSLIDRGCGILGRGLEKISKTNSQGVGIVHRVGKK